MTTSRRPAAPPVSPRADEDPWSASLRRQLECSTLGMVAMLESAEALNRVLLDYSRAARERHEALRHRIHATDGAPQLLALESELWSVDTELATRCWNEISETMTHMTSEWLDETSKAFGAARV